MDPSMQAPAIPVRILIVEDSPTQAQRLQHILEQQGYEVGIAGNGRLALDMTAQFRPALIISDVIMPEMDGYELSRRIKADTDLREIPVILVTTMSDPQDVIHGLECGADNFVLKPYDENYLLGRVRYVLLNREMRQADETGMGVEIYFNGERHFITADRLQILNLLLSTYDAAIQRNKELNQSQEALQQSSSEVLSANRFLDSLIENIPNMIFIKNAADLRFVRLNRAGEALLGCARDEVLGKNDYDLFPREEADAFTSKDRETLARGTIEDIPEEPVHTHDKGIRILHTKKVPLFDEHGQLSHLLGISEDVTEQREMVNEIKRLNTELAQRAEHLEASNKELIQAKATAEQANQTKSAFLSSMSHELRTPLNAILGFGQILASESMPSTPEQKKEFVNHILTAGRHLLVLINEVLDLAKVESGTLTLSPEPVTLAEVLLECQEMIEPLAKDRNIRMMFPQDERSYVLADRTRLKQTLLNLLSNAIKYNRVGGSVVVACTTDTAGHVRISIQDTGVGLSAEKLGQLFQPFNRLGQEGGVEEGTGIGLVVTKRLIELMGGTIGVSSTVGIGSVFWIELQATDAIVPATGNGTIEALPPVEAEQTDQVKQTDASLHTLLYVEDNPANLELVEQLISFRPDLRLLTAAEGQLGIELARAHQPDVILMDINLPDISGNEALIILRNDPKTAHIPVIALTANAMPRAVSESMAYGFFRYIVKPINIDDFFEILDGALEFSKHKRSQSKENEKS